MGWYAFHMPLRAIKIAGSLASIILATAAFAQERLLWGSLEPGKFGVGFRAEVRFDAARQYDAEYVRDAENPPERKPRPILVAVWYPAAKGGPQMAYRGYLELPSTSKSKGFIDRLGLLTPDTLALEVLGKGLKESSREEAAAYDRLLATQTFAVKNAPALPGKFPIVIHHPGLGGSYEDNATLCEYLASHGYVVISSAYQMAESTIMNIDWDLDRSLRDLEFLAQAAGEMKNVDAGRIGVMGHSYGAQAALAWAAEPFCSLRALITLDSGLETEPLTYPGIEKLHVRMEANRLNIRCPVLRFTKQSEVRRFDYLDPYLKFAPSYESTVGSVTHNDFLTHGAIRPALLPSKWPDAARAQAVRESYDRICIHILAFLDATLKQSPQAKELLKRSQSGEGVDKNFTFRFRAGLPAPPNARQIVEIVRLDGIDRTVALLRKCKDDVQVGGDGIGGAAQILAREGKLTLAVELVGRSSEFFPDSMPIFSNLGSLLAKAGEKQKAITAYLRARECVAFQKVDAATKVRWTKEIEDRLKALGWQGALGVRG